MQLTIELPQRDDQLDFNRRRWEEVCADLTLAKWPGRVETNGHGAVLLQPPPSGAHSRCQGEIGFLLWSLLGKWPLPACPISTMDGVRAADVGWYSEARFERVKGQIAFETAPEICVEVISPSNTSWEMREKRQLYFEAGAEEVWLCAEDGGMTFFSRAEPDRQLEHSVLCAVFPKTV